MKTADTSFSVCEHVPQGYENWWEFYKTRQAKKLIMKEFVGTTVGAAVLLFAYALVGALECM